MKQNSILTGVAGRALIKFGKRFSLSLALAAAGLGLLTGCSSPHVSSATAESGPPPATNVLRVGVTPTMPPMIFKEGKEFTGIEAELARQLGAELGKSVQFVELPWENQIDALLSGRIDIIMSNLSMTRARAMRIAFAQPYMRSGQTALARRSEAAAVQISLFSSKYRIGVQRGTTGDYFVQQELPHARRQDFDNARAGAEALVGKDIDAFIHDAPVNWWLASENEARGITLIPGMLTEEYLAWGVRKDDELLLNAANRFLETIKQNGKLQSTIRRWIPAWN